MIMYVSHICLLFSQDIVLVLFNLALNQLPWCQQSIPCSSHLFIAGWLPEEGIWRVWQGRRNHQPDLHGDDPEEHGGGRHQGAVAVETEIIISSYLHTCIPLVVWHGELLSWGGRGGHRQIQLLHVLSGCEWNDTVVVGRNILKMMQTDYPTFPCPGCRQVPDRGWRGADEGGAEGGVQDLRQGGAGLHHHRCAQGRASI